MTLKNLRSWFALAATHASLLLAPFAIVGCGEPPVESPRPKSEDGSGAVHGHDSPSETCFICDPGKREAGRLWCTKHARYEDRCWLCQPQLEDEHRLYCEEHGLYEDECHLCRPDLSKPADGEESSSSVGPSEPPDELFCGEHRVPEFDCGICQPQRTAELEPGDELKVRFESVRSAEKAGVRTAPARVATAVASVRALCEVEYNQNEFARITPLASGIVRQVHADVGARVKAGDVLVELHSAEIAHAKAEFISAMVDLDLKEVACERERRLADKRISSEKEVQEADAARKTAELTANTARQRLLNFGLSAEELEAAQEEQDSSSLLHVRAPYDGTLVRRSAVVGEVVEPGDELFSLANLSTMWLSLSVPAGQADLLDRGQAVEATFGDLETRGQLTWVNTAIDERSRMLKARAEADNTSGRLRAGMFGDARILLPARGDAVEVPREAVQHFEGRPYVFVKLEDDLYSLRRVELSASARGDYVAVLAGLEPSEPVVAVGAFTVMSEFLKSRLGAGCVDD